MSKKTKIDKVAKETGVDASDLARLPSDALDKIDALVPDEDLLGEPHGKKLLGYHPITGAEVWAE